MRIVMFVRNDVTVDARVLKEAATLTGRRPRASRSSAPAGPDGPTGVEREQRDGFEIVRVPLPNWRRWWRWLRAPSRVWSMVRRRSIRARPGERMDGLDWVAMWRFGTLGWARAAAREAGAGRRLSRPRPDRAAGRRVRAAGATVGGSSTTATSCTSSRRRPLGGRRGRSTGSPAASRRGRPMPTRS